MRFSESQKTALKMALADRIRKGEFEELAIKQNDNGLSLAVRGELFGIIGAVAHVLQGFSKDSGIPVFVLSTYVGLAMEIVDEVLQMEEQEIDEECQEQQFTEFMDILTGENKQEDK